MNLRLSYESEPGDVLSDLGKGRVLIRNPHRQDRVLDRKTGVITDGQLSEWHGIGKHILMTLVFVAVASLVVLYATLR